MTHVGPKAHVAESHLTGVRETSHNWEEGKVSHMGIEIAKFN